MIEYKEREDNLKQMNNSIMSALNDLSKESNPFSVQYLLILFTLKAKTAK